MPDSSLAQRSLIYLIFLLGIHIQAQEIAWPEQGFGGKIERDTIWPVSTYLITADIIVPAGVHWRIAAGTRLGFLPETGIRLEGKLTIEGSQQAGVLFSIAEKLPIEYTWQGIRMGAAASLQAQYWTAYYADTLLQGQPRNLQIDSCVWAFHRLAMAWRGETFTNAVIHQTLLAFNQTALWLGSPVDRRQWRDNRFCANVVPLAWSPRLPSAGLPGQCWCADQFEYLAASGLDIRAFLPLATDCPPEDHPLLRGGGNVTIVIDDDLGITPIEPREWSGLRLPANLVQDTYYIENQGISLQYALINLQGQRIVQGIVPDRQKRQFHWGNLPRGIYTLRLQRGQHYHQLRLVLVP